jgi:hypothetical protein
MCFAGVEASVLHAEPSSCRVDVIFRGDNSLSAVPGCRQTKIGSNCNTVSVCWLRCLSCPLVLYMLLFVCGWSLRYLTLKCALCCSSQPTSVDFVNSGSQKDMHPYQHIHPSIFGSLWGQSHGGKPVTSKGDPDPRSLLIRQVKGRRAARD